MSTQHAITLQQESIAGPALCHQLADCRPAALLLLTWAELLMPATACSASSANTRVPILQDIELGGALGSPTVSVMLPREADDSSVKFTRTISSEYTDTYKGGINVSRIGNRSRVEPGKVTKHRDKLPDSWMKL